MYKICQYARKSEVITLVYLAHAIIEVNTDGTMKGTRIHIRVFILLTTQSLKVSRTPIIHTSIKLNSDYTYYTNFELHRLVQPQFIVRHNITHTNHEEEVRNPVSYMLPKSIHASFSPTYVLLCCDGSEYTVTSTCIHRF